MKRVLTLALAAFLALGLFGCSGNGGKKESSDKEPEAQSSSAVSEAVPAGERFDFGRVSAIIPEGWNPADLGEMADGFNAAIIKGSPDQLGKVSQVSIIYCLPTEIIVSPKEMLQEPKNLEPFDLGGYHWTAWEAVYNGVTFRGAETYNDDGAVFVYLMQAEDGAILDFEEPDVRTIMGSIETEPTMEADWITINEDGSADAVLPSVEGYEWDGSSYMVSNDVEVERDISENHYHAAPVSGSGVLVEKLMLENEDSSKMGEAVMAFRITGGKVEALLNADRRIYDAPEIYEEPEDNNEDNVDYEAYAEFYTGIWRDANNDLTMFIQKDEILQHGFIISIQSKNRTLTAGAVLQESGQLVYEKISVGGMPPVESAGWFVIDGAMLIWGHDDAAGDFSYATLFARQG
ncbi:MAG: hypothetical protein IJH99_02445 [Eubacterium sp.]|nr:hypothetical protein [Eubacterium sp.]